MRRLAPVLRELLAAGSPVGLVTVAGARGSTPRELGTRMLVTPDRFFGTIGGGRLEYDAIRETRRLLDAGEAHALREVPLGPALGQCCGGHATVLIERAGEVHLKIQHAIENARCAVLVTRLDQPGARALSGLGVDHGIADDLPAWVDLPALLERGVGERVALPDGSQWLVEPFRQDLPEVFIFGAGHVGRALCAALSSLPCRVRLFDDRPDLLVDLPDGIEGTLSEHPADRILEAHPHAFFLIMTPSHDLDCELCEAVLRRGDFAFLGLIGSATKRARFEKRWRAKGLSESLIRRLVCPIGLPGIAGKEPAVIAASTAAQLLQEFERNPNPTPWWERPV